MKRKEKTISINVPLKGNGLLEKCLDRINGNPELFALWEVMNVNALDRLEMTDHGPVHFQIVSNIALRVSRILRKNGVPMSIEKDFDLDPEYGEVVVFLASILHDLGMSISREGHEEFSLFLANSLLKDILSFLPDRERTIVTSEVLHSIIMHRKGGTPYTIEAGIVRVADALDMSEGRSRIPYEAGKIDIHSLSATAIDEIQIEEGKDRPIQITIKMNNSSGIFQVDELLKSKLKGSGIEKYISVRAIIDAENEKKLIQEFEVKS